jgi:hypothetical protein
VEADIAAAGLDLTEDEFAALLRVCAARGGAARAPALLARVGRELTRLAPPTLAAAEAYFRRAPQRPRSLPRAFSWRCSCQSDGSVVLDSIALAPVPPSAALTEQSCCERRAVRALAATWPAYMHMHVICGVGAGRTLTGHARRRSAEAAGALAASGGGARWRVERCSVSDAGVPAACPSGRLQARCAPGAARALRGWAARVGGRLEADRAAGCSCACSGMCPDSQVEHARVGWRVLRVNQEAAGVA